MSKETIKVVEINTDPAKKSIKDLRKEIMELKSQMANLDEDSEAFGKLANKAGELKHQIDEINERVKGSSSDFGDMVGNIANVTAGLVGAFSAVQGGLQAMGVESEAIDETIKRMQGLMAVVQGLSTIDKAIDGMNDLRNAITSTSGAAKVLKAVLTPKVFLAIAGAITAVTLILNKFRREQEELLRAQREYNEKLAEEKRIREEFNRTQYLNDLNSELRIKQEIAGVEFAGDDLEYQRELLKIYQKEFNQLVFERDAYMKGMYAVGENPEEEIKKREDALRKIIPLLNETRENIKILEAIAPVKAAKERRDAAEAEAKAKEKAAKAEAEAAAKAKENYDEEIRVIAYLKTLYAEIYGENSIEYQKEFLNLEERSLQNIKTYFGETSEEYKKQLKIVIDLRKKFEELTAVKEETLSNEEIELALENDRLKEMAKGWLYNEETAIETFDRISEELKTALDRDLITQEQYDTAVKNLAKERSRYIADQSVKAFASTANFVTTILDGIADQQDQNNKEGFEKSKKLQIASATIQMFTGIATALAGAFTTKTGPWDIALAAIQAATIAASGILNINKIKNTTFDGGGSATPSASAVNATIVPPVQYSNAVQGAELNGNIQNQKVYVTESDIVDTIGKVSVQETENTY